MRKNTWLVSLLAIGLGGCGLIEFDLNEKVPEQRIQGSLLSGVLPSFLPSPVPLSLDVQAASKAMGTGPVTAASLKSLTFAITATAMPSGDSDDFDFVRSIDVFVESRKQGSALPRVKIADLPSHGSGDKQLSLRTYPEVNLLPYINEGCEISASATGTAPPDDVTFDGQVVVRAKL
ncbi:MAG: hypothetical protein U1A78_02465 [Polyangia bacterium]